MVLFLVVVIVLVLLRNGAAMTAQSICQQASIRGGEW